MASVAPKLTWAEFQAQYGQSEQLLEYWFGEAIPKSMPTWLHGLLQIIIAGLLQQAGYRVGSEVELRISSDAHPRPDIIATRGKVEMPYPTRAVEIVVEILSEDDKMSHMLSKCRVYQEWGFQNIYLVDPQSQKVLEWVKNALIERDALGPIPADQIWSALAEALA